MPVYGITVTRSVSFGIDCDNMLQARAGVKRFLKELEDQGLLEWNEEISDPEEIPEEDIIYTDE